MLQKIMGLPELGPAEVAGMKVEDLEASFSRLEADYNRQFKRS